MNASEIEDEINNINPVIPPIIVSELSKLSTRKFEYTTYKQGDIIKQLLDSKKIEINEKTRVLDCGCGLFGFYPYFSKCNYIGVDINEYVVPPEGAKFLKRSLNNVSFKKNSFDIILCNDVLSHLSSKDIDKLVKKMKSWLSNSGVLLIKDFVIKDEGAEDLRTFLNTISYCTNFYIQPKIMKDYLKLFREHFKVEESTCDRKLEFREDFHAIYKIYVDLSFAQFIPHCLRTLILECRKK